MANWQGWVAAVGGLLTLGGSVVTSLTAYNWLWGLVALVFGVWASMA